MTYPQYQPATDNRPLSDAELDALDELLAGLDRDEALNIEALDGYLAALLLSPVPLPTLPAEDWLPRVWGGDTPNPFVSGKQCKKAVSLVLRHLQSIAVAWATQPQAWEPIFSVADSEDGVSELADAQDWAAGFLLGVSLAPDAWSPRFEGGETAPVLAGVARLGADDTAELSLAELDDLSRALPDTILTLYKHLSHT